jgi:dihydrofolate reductase
MSLGQDRGLSICGEGPSRDTDQEESDMARLIYSAIASLNGYVEDERGRFDWAAPDDEVLAAVNNLERPIGTYLYGRRMYETMVFWETARTGADQSAGVRDFAELWRVSKKVVYSRTLQRVTSARTRIEREFNPGAVRRLKGTSVSDITVGGAELAGQAITAGLVDECHLFLNPILVGGGKRALPDKVLGFSSWMSADSGAASSTSTTASGLTNTARRCWARTWCRDRDGSPRWACLARKRRGTPPPAFPRRAVASVAAGVVPAPDEDQKPRPPASRHLLSP